MGKRGLVAASALAILASAELLTISADLVICTGPARALGAADCHTIGERVEAAAAKAAAALGLWGKSQPSRNHYP